jgi:hypothetical protein
MEKKENSSAKVLQEKPFLTEEQLEELYRYDPEEPWYNR